MVDSDSDIHLVVLICDKDKTRRYRFARRLSGDGIQEPESSCRWCKPEPGILFPCDQCESHGYEEFTACQESRTVRLVLACRLCDVEPSEFPQNTPILFLFHPNNAVGDYEERNAFRQRAGSVLERLRAISGGLFGLVRFSGGNSTRDLKSVCSDLFLENRFPAIVEAILDSQEKEKNVQVVLDRINAEWLETTDYKALVGPLEALDILLQGYLVINDNGDEVSSGQSMSWREFRQEYDILTKPEQLATAKDLTSPKHLDRPVEDGNVTEWWFEPLAEVLPQVYCESTDKCVINIEEAAGCSEPSLGEALHSTRAAEAGGALRRVVEVLREGNDRAIADPQWPGGFSAAGPDQAGNILELFRRAHDEYVLAVKKIKSISMKQYESFDSRRAHLHHDRLCNEFLVTMGYAPLDSCSEARYELMQEFLAGRVKAQKRMARGCKLWDDLEPEIRGFLSSLKGTYGFVLTEAFEAEKKEVECALELMSDACARLTRGALRETDVAAFWTEADKVRSLLANMSKSRRFGDYVTDIDPDAVTVDTE